MPNSRPLAEIQLEANLAQLRDTVLSFEEDGESGAKFDNDFISLEHDPDDDSYSVTIHDEDVYSNDVDERVGSIGMSLFFIALL